MLVPRWRNLLCLKNISLIPETPSSTYHASFHSTSLLSEKWKKVSDSQGKVHKRERSSKDHIRYTVRQKRSDAKKALNHLLFHAGGIRISLKDERSFDSPSKKCKPGLGKKPRDKRTKRWHRRGSLYDDDYDAEARFEVKFAEKSYSWSFKKGSCSRHSASPGFEWREGWSWTSQTPSASDDESRSVGCRSDRAILGLPQFGPLKMEDVKKAFKAAAFKWHPDKNQGPSQATAQEKFKLCLDAYNSLCSVLEQR